MTVLRHRGEQLANWAAERFGGAELTGLMEADRLRTYDPRVQQFYDCQNVVSQFSISGGKIHSLTRCGLAGGAYRDEGNHKLK